MLVYVIDQDKTYRLVQRGNPPVDTTAGPVQQPTQIGVHWVEAQFGGVWIKTGNLIKLKNVDYLIDYSNPEITGELAIGFSSLTSFLSSWSMPRCPCDDDLFSNDCYNN
jgi:hypothetical protein